MAKAPALQDVGTAVRRLQARHQRVGGARMSAIGLSLAQWGVLRHLRDHPDASLHKLAGLMFQTDQSMGALAARMITQGLLERVEGPGRAVHHRLTPLGERLRAEGSEVVDGVLAESLGRLSSRELSVLYSLLRKAAGPEDGL